MKIAWLTDIHLNFLDKNQRKTFYEKIAETSCNAVLISGDIAEADCVEKLLIEMANRLETDIYFVLGNHDYYRGKINEVRSRMKNLTKTYKSLFWLPALEIKILAKNTILLGQDGWADGRLGDYQNSNLSLNDSRMIIDLFQEKLVGKTALLKKMQELADYDKLVCN